MVAVVVITDGDDDGSGGDRGGDDGVDHRSKKQPVKVFQVALWWRF